MVAADLRMVKMLQSRKSSHIPARNPYLDEHNGNFPIYAVRTAFLRF